MKIAPVCKLCGGKMFKAGDEWVCQCQDECDHPKWLESEDGKTCVACGRFLSPPELDEEPKE